MNYTPGPWLATSQAVYTAISDERSKHPDDRQAIAQIVEGWDNETGRANARLIAAAPDLLAACQWVVNDMAYKAPEEFADEAVHSRWLAKLREAIVKATEGKDNKNEFQPEPGMDSTDYSPRLYRSCPLP